VQIPPIHIYNDYWNTTCLIFNTAVFLSKCICSTGFHFPDNINCIENGYTVSFQRGTIILKLLLFWWFSGFLLLIMQSIIYNIIRVVQWRLLRWEKFVARIQLVIYISLLGNYQAKRPSENLEKYGKIMFQNYNVRMTTGLTFLKM